MSTCSSISGCIQSVGLNNAFYIGAGVATACLYGTGYGLTIAAVCKAVEYFFSNPAQPSAAPQAQTTAAAARPSAPLSARVSAPPASGAQVPSPAAPRAHRRPAEQDEYKQAPDGKDLFLDQIDLLGVQGTIWPSNVANIKHTYNKFKGDQGQFLDWLNKVPRRYLTEAQKNDVKRELSRSFPQAPSSSGARNQPPQDRASLIAIYSNTRRAWGNPQVNQNQRQATRDGAKKVAYPQIPTTKDTNYAVKAVVDQRGSTTVALEMRGNGLNPLVMNLGNKDHRGGGVANGARAQEETLCRQSNLMEGLEAVNYPLGEFEGVFTPGVQFIRDDNYNFIRSVQLDVGTIAAYQLRTTNQREEPIQPDVSSSRYDMGTKAKIRTFLRMAIENGNDSVVLGALGCGAFGNDPRKVSQLYKEVLQELEFQYKFEKIRFAIIPDHNDPQNRNVTEFQATFS